LLGKNRGGRETNQSESSDHRKSGWGFFLTGKTKKNVGKGEEPGTEKKPFSAQTRKVQDHAALRKASPYSPNVANAGAWGIWLNIPQKSRGGNRDLVKGTRRDSCEWIQAPPETRARGKEKERQARGQQKSRTVESGSCARYKKGRARGRGGDTSPEGGTNWKSGLVSLTHDEGGGRSRRTLTKRFELRMTVWKGFYSRRGQEVGIGRLGRSLGDFLREGLPKTTSKCSQLRGKRKKKETNK